MKVKILNSFLFVFGIAVSVKATSIIPPPPGNQCLAPNGQKGLGPTMRMLVDLLPADRFLQIYVYAVSHDQQVQKAMEYLEGSDFRKIVVTMHNTSEFSNVMEYICNELYFDAYFYLNSLGEIFNFPPMTRPPPHNRHKRESNLSYRPGFQGFLEDLRDAIPLDQIKEMYKKRLADDEYLRLAMKKIGSKEFRRIGDAIEALPEYQNMLQRLRNIGVNVDKILKSIMNFFGWKIHPQSIKI